MTIKSIKHKGLKKLYENPNAKINPALINPKHLNRLEIILAILDNDSLSLNDFDLSYHLHPLKGNLKDYYSVWVDAVWRVIFKYSKENREVSDVDYLNYHS